MSTTLGCSLERERDFSVAPSAFAVEEARKRFAADLIAGLNSGLLPPVTPEYWEKKLAALRAKFGKVDCTDSTLRHSRVGGNPS